MIFYEHKNNISETNHLHWQEKGLKGDVQFTHISVKQDFFHAQIVFSHQNLKPLKWVAILNKQCYNVSNKSITFNAYVGIIGMKF